MTRLRKLLKGGSGEVLQVKQKKELVQGVRINDLCHVALFGNIQISTAAVQALCDADIPVTYFSKSRTFVPFFVLPKLTRSSCG